MHPLAQIGIFVYIQYFCSHALRSILFWCANIYFIWFTYYFWISELNQMLPRPEVFKSNLFLSLLYGLSTSIWIYNMFTANESGITSLRSLQAARSVIFLEKMTKIHIMWCFKEGLVRTRTSLDALNNQFPKPWTRINIFDEKYTFWALYDTFY